MSATLLSRIAAVIQTRLRSVSVANGYNQTLKDVVRPGADGITDIEHLKCVLIQSANITKDDKISALGAPSRTGRSVGFGIVVYLRPDDKYTPLDDMANAVAFDCIKAISQDDEWWKFDGLAIRADWGDIDFNPAPNGEYLEIVIGLQVLFRTQDKEPATAA